VAGQSAVHGGRKTVRLRDFDFVRNMTLTMQSGTDRTPATVTEAGTAAKERSLEEAVASRKRKRRGL